MAGILAYGAYVPYHRLDRVDIAASLGVPAGKGTRTVASYDEDTTSMGVEAARAALASWTDLAPASGPSRLRAVLFATTDPAYLDKTNATAIHAALGLAPAVAAYDMVGSVRSGVGALRSGLDSFAPTLVVCADVRTGLPGGADERDGGDGAVALVVGGQHEAMVDHLGSASATAELLDRWRRPGEAASQMWEERFGEHAYLPLAQGAFADALEASGIAPGAIDHLIVTGTHARAARSLARALVGQGVRPEAVADDLAATVGNTGTAHPGLVLADVLDRARPGAVIAVVTLADGVDVELWGATDKVDSGRHLRRSVADQVAAGRPDLPYATFLTWRGQLHREPPRRPDPERPAAPPSARAEPWKFAFVGSRCRPCGTRHLPPQQVCVRCRAVGQMEPERMADVGATIATFTVDRLAYSLSPPVVAAVVDFDGGGRFQCELTDVDPDAVAIGDRVEMTFRRLFSAGGVHNYFWKARPAREGSADRTDERGDH